MMGNRVDRLIKVVIAAGICGMCVCGCSKRCDKNRGTGDGALKLHALQQELSELAAEKDACVGIAVIIDRKDTVQVNGDKDFPMLSVYKFPQALAVADFCKRNQISLSDTLSIRPDELRPNTWSPLIESYGRIPLRLPIEELLAFSLQHSDNNACDILFHLIGGTSVADSVINGWGFPRIQIKSTENKMHLDTDLCYHNTATPLEMARLLDEFNNTMRMEEREYAAIADLMEACTTGADRIVNPIALTNAVVGHKTGTGDKNAADRIIAVNDVGYVNIPDGPSYSIAVFVSDSAYDMATTSGIIADISEKVYETIVK